MSKNSSKMWNIANLIRAYNWKEKIEKYWYFWKKWGHIRSEELDSNSKMLKEKDRGKIFLDETDSNDQPIYFY